MITLNVNGNTYNWEEFREDHPRHSIALDGYVRGGPKFCNERKMINFNHHEDVDRLATRSTCAQVLMAIRQGLFEVFRDENGILAYVLANDCDEDVCTAWTLLNNSHLVVGTMNPMINKLVAMEDALDCTAGAYPFPKDLPALRELAWIFQPYRQFRTSGQIDKRIWTEFEEVIYTVEDRIIKYITGHGKELPLDTRYEVIGGGKGWSMVKEIGAQARTGMLSDGIRVFVSLRERPDGNNNYIIGKMAPFHPLNLSRLVETLNIMENNQLDKWGGADTIIGSPRNAGSKISIEDFTKLIDLEISYK